MVILASKSPRRQELLRQLGIAFRVETADIDEVTTGRDLFAIPEVNALQKARCIAAKHPFDTVIGADTAIVFQNRLIGKPSTLEKAKQMLADFSGNEHCVVTGVAVIADGKETVWREISEVRFKTLTPETIDRYLNAVSVLDKAGAYAIQSHGDWIIDSYTGELENIVGLPLQRLRRVLKL